MSIIKKEWLVFLIMALPLIFVLVYWNQFPETVAIHFDQHGVANGYASKAFGLLMLPCMNVAVYILFKVAPRIDPARKNYETFARKIWMVQLATHAFMSFLSLVIAVAALGVHMEMAKVVVYAVLLLFLVLGNYMGNLRQNYFFGIRTPWTLANTEVWTKTHRLTAKLWVFATLVMMIVMAFLDNFFGPFMLYVTVIAAVPIGYSYYVYRQVVPR
jgi:uncharacterized membrane protein